MVEMKQLNKTELQIMEYLWKLEKGFMKDIVDLFPQPKPAYTTISTLLSRMCTKNYVGFTKLGRDKHYFPILKKKSYFSNQLKTMITHFFDDSSAQFASFFTKNTELSMEELIDLQKIVNDQITNKKMSKS
jgi:BlaI family penicillinase repressor